MIKNLSVARPTNLRSMPRSPMKTLTALLTRYGSECTRKIIMTISWFNMLARFLNGCRVPLETEDKIGTRTSPF